MIPLSAYPHQPTHQHRSNTGPKRGFTTKVPQVWAISEFLRVGNALWLSTENMVWTVHDTIFSFFFLCKDLKYITVNFNTRAYKDTVLQHFNPQSYVLVGQLKQRVIKWELYMVQNPSKPEPRQGAANSFLSLIPSALNCALQASITTFMTCFLQSVLSPSHHFWKSVSHII